MLKQSLVLDYLKWADRETERLFQTVRLPKPRMSTAIAEVPAFDSLRDEERFVASAQKGGYVAANLSLLKYENGLYRENFLKQLKVNLPIRSAHGSSIKRQIKTGVPYKKFLIKDLSLLRSLHLKAPCAVNFDLYAGQPSDLKKSKSFEITRTRNLKSLCGILNIKPYGDADYALLKNIIGDVGSVFRNSGFDVVFELPGSKGWSMFPEISEKHLEQISQLIKKYLPAAKLCIDVGHVITWGTSASRLNDYLNILGRYKEIIGMLHISSAGSDTVKFEKLYRSIYGQNIPSWHSRGLDLSLAVCESKQIKLISDIRSLCKSSPLLEVSETRTPREAIKDYFGQFDLNFIDDSSYFKNLPKQGKILGYA